MKVSTFRFVLLLATISLGPMAGAAETTGAGARPNIIFILTDDLGYGDIGVFYQQLRQVKGKRDEPWHFTPHLDELAAQGVQLRGHYCPAPVCAPSRASLLTGLHQGHATVRDNQFDKALADNHTLATVLHSAGYATAAIGKWGLQGAGTNPQQWPAYPTKRGFDSFFGYVRHNDGHEHYPKEGTYQGAKEVWDQETEISAQLDRCYTTDLFTARAKKWLVDQHAAHVQQPFFLYLAYDTPHATTELPTQAYPAGAGVHGGLQWTGMPGSMINTATGTVDSYFHPDYAAATWDHDGNPATEERPWPEVDKRYATAVRRIDDAVGDLVQTLKDLGIDDNTLIVFASDNGPSNESYLKQPFLPNFFRSYGPFEGIKRDIWEGGLRVGALARWPAIIPPHRVSEAPSQFHDWLATFAEAAGTVPPAKTDGVSLLPTLSGQGGQRPSTVYSEYFFAGKAPSYPDYVVAKRNRVRQQMQAIRVGDFLGLRMAIQSHAQDFEIYDVIHDPAERVDVAAQHPELQQQFHEAVLRLRRPDPSAPRPYDAELVPALPARPVVPGVEWRAYEQAAAWVPQWELLAPAQQGVSPGFDLKVRTRESDFGVLFTGYVQVPVDGEYTFYLQARGRALLRVHEATVLDADFGYQGQEVRGAMPLQAGLHPFRLYYASAGAAAPSLDLQWSSANLGRKPIAVESLVRAAEARPPAVSLP